MMKFWTVLITGALLSILVAAGCSGESDPINPSPTGIDSDSMASGRCAGSQTCLWGYYNVTIDPVNMKAEAVVDRTCMFTANVTNFLNMNPASMTFLINDVQVQPGYTDVDIDVGLTHPFPGLPRYNGYDVRGIFMGNGSAELKYRDGLMYPVLAADQYMLNDPRDDIGGPDGYTRWFNLTEFNMGGMPLFQYTQGRMATP